MRKLFISMVLICLSVMANAQVVAKSELSGIKPGSVIGFECDFSDAVIMGMDEEAFSKYETDWTTDKPTIVSNFMSGINNKLDGVLVVGHFKEAKFTLKVSVKNVAKTGYMLCDAKIVDSEGNTCFIVKQVNGGTEPPLLPGTKLAKMKMWALLTGRSLGGILRSEYLNQ